MKLPTVKLFVFRRAHTYRIGIIAIVQNVTDGTALT
jgi:hypothetical protein